MTRGSVQEYVLAIRSRYLQANRGEKGKILGEFCQATGYHRKAAVRLLRRPPVASQVPRQGRPVRYGAPVREALFVAWEALDRPCGKRLQPFLPELVAQLERHGELAVDADVRGLLGMVSASTIDRLLQRYRRRSLRLPWTQGKSDGSLRREVSVRTFGEWRGVRPGEFQADLVGHCGVSTAGFYLTTLVAVDVATGWCAREAVWGKGKERVGTAVHRIRVRLPFPMRHLHTDNGSEFLNHLLVPWCRREGVPMTRGRPYQKKDQAWVEQKNNTAVRRLVGYDRYSSHAAHQQLGRIYAIADDYFNFFQPVAKLVGKQRDGARVTKHYDEAHTPYQRLTRSGVLDPTIAAQLAQHYETLNPVTLRRDLDLALRRLWDTRDRAFGNTLSEAGT